MLHTVSRHVRASFQATCSTLYRQSRDLNAGPSRTPLPVVSIVGSGPAGFGIAQFLLKNNSNIRINMIEKRPVPYGLVRYGVSPDHQDVKNCINGYEKVAENPRLSFYGGVAVGETLSLDDLMLTSNCIVFCHGAQEMNRLHIPGEDLSNVFNAKEFVGWFNGDEEYSHSNPGFNGDTAVIVGVGNVALDCARMILKPTRLLQETDITQHALKCLEQSNIKNVILIGRRGPLQMACTRRELSEIMEINDIHTTISNEYFTDSVKDALNMKKLSLRKTQRLVKYMMKYSNNDVDTASRNFSIKLMTTPIEICGDNTVSSVLVRNNIVSGGDAFNPKIIPGDVIEKIPCSIVITAIGYGNKVLDERISNTNGCINAVKGRLDFPFPIYACGWCRTGPKGVLADTLNDCLVTGGRMIKDLDSWSDAGVEQPLHEILRRKNIEYLSWKHWKQIDAHEISSGCKIGKIREKIIAYDDMASIAFGNGK